MSAAPGRSNPARTAGGPDGMPVAPPHAAARSDALPAFTALFQDNEDPWGFRARWYEQRKRALTLACLPRPRYASAYEPGCANGELAADLAPRCDHLLCSDFVPAAVELARRRLVHWPHAVAMQARTPDEWPDADFDLVVVSELGYFLEPSAVDELARRIRGSLRSHATVVACHWRHAIAGYPLDGDAVHRQLHRALRLPALGSIVDEDLRIDVWDTDPRSLATREGLA
jgi:hypothetical protein